MIDWTNCPDVECIAGKVSGAPLVRGTRIPADAVIANAEDGYTVDEIATNIFEGLPVERTRRAIEFARAHAHSA